jgi:hypothetical protein
MTRVARDAIESVEEFAQVVSRLRQSLRQVEPAARRLKVGLEDGMSAAELLAVTRTAEIRRQLTDTLVELGFIRHRMRLELVALCLAEGASISDVGRLLGISRQLAQRLAHEAVPPSVPAKGRRTTRTERGPARV